MHAPNQLENAFFSVPGGDILGLVVRSDCETKQSPNENFVLCHRVSKQRMMTTCYCTIYTAIAVE